MILQLNPAIPLETPKGPGLCHFLIDYGHESHLYWVVFLNDTGECWTFANPEIRAEKNITIGRKIEKPQNYEFPECERCKAKLDKHCVTGKGIKKYCSWLCYETDKHETTITKANIPPVI